MNLCFVYSCKIANLNSEFSTFKEVCNLPAFIVSLARRRHLLRDFAYFFAPKHGKSSTSNRLLNQNTMRGLSLVLASHSFATLVNLSLFSYKFATIFIQIRHFLAFSSFLRSFTKARLISPNLPILMCCFCRLRTKFLTKFLCKISLQIQSTAL